MEGEWKYHSMEFSRKRIIRPDYTFVRSIHSIFKYSLLKISSLIVLSTFFFVFFSKNRTSELSIVNVAVMFLFMILHAPLVRAFIGASVTREFRLGVDAFEFSMSPQRSVNRVRFPTIDAHETSLSNI